MDQIPREDTRRLELEDANPNDLTPPPPAPFQLWSRREVTLVVQGLEKRAAAAESLATKAKTESYFRQASEFMADKQMIEDIILPVFRTQQDLPLVTPEHMKYAILNLLGEAIAMAANKTPRPDKSVLENTLAACLIPAFEHLYQAAWGAGFAARQDSPDQAIARACVRASADRARQKEGRQ